MPYPLSVPTPSRSPLEPKDPIHNGTFRAGSVVDPTLESMGTLLVNRLGEEVIRVATAVKPTNEQIVEMLSQVLRELGKVKKTQDQLAADLRRVAQSIK